MAKPDDAFEGGASRPPRRTPRHAAHARPADAAARPREINASTPPRQTRQVRSGQNAGTQRPQPVRPRTNAAGRPVRQPAQVQPAQTATPTGRRQPPSQGRRQIPDSMRSAASGPRTWDSSDASLVGERVGTHEQVYRVKRRRHRHRGRKIAIAVACVLVVVIAVCGVSGFMLLKSAQNVKANADEALAVVDSAAGKATSGDMAGFASDVDTLASLASTMEEETSSPLWTAASFIPVYGSDISAARTIVSALSDVSNEALVPFAASAQGVSLDSLLVDGRVDVAMLQTLADGLSNVAPIIQTANDQIQNVGPTHIDQITQVVDKAKDAMGMISDAADAASQLAPLLPQMLGANGEARTYLILAMTNSEIRAAGGFPGAQGIMTVSDGNLEMGEFQDRAFGLDNEVAITDEEYALFQGEDFTSNMMKVNSGDALFDPNFPRASERIAQFWEYTHPDEIGGSAQNIDGVIAVDPVLLQYLLGAVGGVTSPDGTVVDGTNTVKYLTSDVYWKYANDTEMQDAIFASVAQSAFDAIIDGLDNANIASFAKAIGRGADEGRILVWMRDDAEEQAVKDLGVSGAIENDPSTAQLGVFVNDYSFTKAEYYLDFDTVVGERVDNNDGSATYYVSTTLKNTMPAELESSLPPYLHSGNHAAYSPGDLMMRLYLYAPAGGSVSDVKASGDTTIDLKDGSYNGISVTFGEMHLQPGQTLTVTYSVTTSSQAGDVELDVRSTPTVQEVRG